MKKRSIISSLIAVAVMALSQEVSAFDPSSLFNGNGLSGIGNAVSSLLANKNFEVDDLVGSWTYTGPAVTLQSENALQKVGGAAAATALEGKLEPYYQRFGMTAMNLTVAEDHSFVMKLKKGQMKGTIEKDEESGKLIFSFNALGKISLGKVSAEASKAGGVLILTFDMSKLVTIVEKVSKISGSTSAKSLSALLSSYDGLYAGFRMKQTDTATKSDSGADSSSSSQGEGLKGLLNSLGSKK